MQSFRNAAKPVVYLLTFTFLAWMIVDLSGLSGNGGLLTQTSVGSINGRSVETLAYQRAVDQAISQQQQATGSVLGLQAQQQVHDQVWEQFIQDVLLQEEYDRRHLTTSVEEITAAIRYNPPEQLLTAAQFQSEGRFDMAKYQAWLLSTEGLSAIPYLEADYRDRILRSKLYSTIVSDVFLSDAALWDQWRYRNETAKIGLTSIVPRVAIADSAVSVSAAEVEAYYKQHPETFRRPRTAFLSYVSVPHQLDASDSAAALVRAREIRAELVAGASFGDVAMRESQDRGSSMNGGELGTLPRGQMVESFENAAFSLPLRTLSEPVLSQFGYHLIEVSARTADSVTARHILIPIELAGAHRDQVDAQIDSLEQLGADRLDPSALDSASRIMRLPIGRALPTAEGAPVAVGSLIYPDAGVWAFRAKKGETSNLIDGEDAHFVFRLDSVQAGGIPPLDQVRSGVEEMVRQEKKEAQSAALGAELVRRLQAGGVSLADASRALGLPYQQHGPFLRQNPPVPSALLIGAVFGTRLGTRSGLVTTPQGHFVFEVLERTTADSTAFNASLDRFRAEMIGVLRQDRIREFQAGLRATAKIKDERAAIFSNTTAQIEERNARLSQATGGTP